MIPRISKRYASTAKPNPKPRKGTKGLSGVTLEHQPVTPEEQVRILNRRIEKAERDGRMDITMALTPVKTYMGGFTRPRDLRALYWSKDGLCNDQKRSYETPPAAVYVPHTVYLLETRYPTTGQQIRAFHSSARRTYPSESYNEDHIVPNFYVKHKKDRKRQADKLMKSPVTPSTTSPSATNTAGLDVETAEQAAHDPARQTRAVKRRKHEESALMEHLSDSILGDDLVAGTRRLVSKIPVEHYDKDGNLAHPSGFVVPGKGHSSTSDAARAKEHARDEDEERAAQTASVAERVLESDLDYVHSAMASTRPRSHKVPFEVREPDGTVKHPSGFVPPTPANEFKYSDSASLERGLAGAISRQRARDAESKNSTTMKGRGLHTSAVARASEVALPTYLIQPVPVPEVDSQVSPGLSESEPAPVDAIRAKYLPTLVVAMAQGLSGARGGFVGIRFSPHERGRGVDGEGLDKALDWNKRVIGVGIGDWFPRAQELEEGFKIAAEEGAVTPYTSEGMRIGNETDKKLAYPSEPVPAKSI